MGYLMDDDFSDSELFQEAVDHAECHRSEFKTQENIFDTFFKALDYETEAAKDVRIMAEELRKIESEEQDD